MEDATNGCKREKLLRDQICDMGRRMYLKDMVAANDGNISAKLEGKVIYLHANRCIERFYDARNAL